MMTSPFPNESDLAFYQSKHTPSWAKKIRKQRGPSLGVPSELLDRCINSHGGVSLNTSAHCAMHNMIAFVRSWERRGENVTEGLRGLSDIGQLGIYADRYRVIAKRWLKRLG